MERGKKRLEKLRKRRQKAVVLFEQGERQCSVAQHLRVSRQSVSEWWLAWHNGDTKALNGATRAGRKPRWTVNNWRWWRRNSFVGLRLMDGKQSCGRCPVSRN